MRGAVRPATLASLLLLAACGPSAPEPANVRTEIYRAGRDGLCVAGAKAGLIAYGPEHTNCSLAGTATRTGDRLVITPRGDERCRVEVRMTGDTALVGQLSGECAYYCGPAADFSGRRLRRSADETPVTDLAGDPLC